MSNPINLHLTKDIGLFLRRLLGHKPCWRHGSDRLWSRRCGACTGLGQQASGSARSRTYITDAGTASASADFLSALPVIPRFPHGGRERARRVRHLHHHLLGAGSVHLPAPAKRVGPAHGPRAAPLRPVFPPRCHARATNDNVVTLPGRGGDTAQKPVETADPAERWKGIAETGSAVAAGLDSIAREDKTFDAKHFVAGARAAYEMIVLAYAEGDRRTLKNLLSREVYEGFEAAIRERENKGETVETRFVAIDKSDIAGVELRGRTAQITVRFVSQLISVTRDKSGNVIEGNAEKVTDVTDVWTFARDLSSRDPNWKLVATEAGQ